MTKIRAHGAPGLKWFVYLFVEAGGRCGKSLVQVGDVMSNVVMGKVVTEPTPEGGTGLEVV